MDPRAGKIPAMFGFLKYRAGRIRAFDFRIFRRFSDSRIFRTQDENLVMNRYLLARVRDENPEYADRVTPPPGRGGFFRGWKQNDPYFVPPAWLWPSSRETV